MKVFRMTALAALLIVFPFAALAQDGGTVVVQERDIETGGNKLGFRGFFGLDPDQFGVGAQSRLGEMLGGQLAPSVDFGFGDNLTTTTINGDVLWDLGLPGSNNAFYIGGGPTLVWWSPEAGDGDLEIGATGVFGMTIPMGISNKYNAEIRYGIGDTPELRFLVGLLIGS